jgi:hypothetical protein
VFMPGLLDIGFGQITAPFSAVDPETERRAVCSATMRSSSVGITQVVTPLACALIRELPP